MGQSAIKTWRYDIPGEPEFYPITFVGAGSIFLGNDGCFSAITDYGNWSYRWPGKYSDFREWFIGFSPDYVLGKITLETEFSLKKVITNIEELLNELDLTDDHLKCLYDQEKELLESFQEESDLDWWRRSSVWGNDSEVVSSFYDYPGQARTFVELFLSRAQEIVRYDLKESGMWDRFVHLEAMRHLAVLES